MMRMKILSEFVGTAILLTANVGSASMAQSLTDNGALRILINCLSTALALGLLITLFAGISGAHFNPAVSLIEFFGKRLKAQQLLGYLLAQFAGGFFGVVIANVMYKSPIAAQSSIQRDGWGILLGELIATGGLVFVINLLRIQKKSELTPVAVASWIAAAFLFTSSTSFANPAVTFARIWTDNISGIAIQSVVPFISAQLLGAVLFSIMAERFKNDERPR
jgi:glycerol uptake facilitator-like aquaporin